MPARSSTYRRLGLAAAVGAFLWPLLVAACLADNIRFVWNHPQNNGRTRTGFVVATLVVLVSLAVQGMAIFRLGRGLEGSERFAGRVAVWHGSMALAVLGLASFGSPMADWYITSSWFIAWISPYNTRPWLLNPFPFLVLGQWAFSAAHSMRSKQEIWRGIATACLAYTALLGVWTFSPNGNAGWRPFTTPATAFFTVGVGIHCLAILVTALRGRSAWILSGIVGFGCLISGFILSIGFNGDLIGFGFNGGEPAPPPFASTVGAVLHLGWFELGAMVPPIAYALVACASVVLFRSRRTPETHPGPAISNSLLV